MLTRPDAYHLVDMSFPTSRSGVICLVPAPRRLTSWLLPFEPFQVSLWLGIVACLIVETFGLMVTQKMGQEHQSWSNSFRFGSITTLKLIISQSTHFVVDSLSVRTVLVSCYIVDIIITSVYSGGLASILTIPSWEEAPDTVDRLVAQELPWAGTSPDWIVTIHTTQEEKLRKLINLYRVYGTEELRQKGLTENIGLVFERLHFGHLAIPSYIDKATADRMKMMTEDIFFEYCIAYASRPWALLERFNKFILMVHSSGLLKYWEWMVVAKHLDEKLQKQIEASANLGFEKSGAVQLGLENFAGICTLWIAGNLLSLFFFLAEILVYSRKNNIKNIITKS